MALIWADKVAETSTTTGTGDFTLAGAITGYQTFGAAMATSDTCYYVITAVDGSGVPTGAWEAGLGTYSASNTLTRTTVQASSNAGAAVNFSAGTKRVTISQTAAAVSNTLNQGVHTIPVAAGAMIPRLTNGAAAGTTETATNKVMVRTFDFDQSTDEHVQVPVPMPKSWDEGTVTVQFIWTASATGDVVWGAQAVAFSDDDALDTAFGTAQTVTDSVTAAGDLMQSSFTSAITVAGTPAAEDTVWLQLYRDANNGSDTLAADASLVGVRIKVSLAAGNDA